MRWLHAEQISSWVSDLLFAPSRRVPVVGITSHPSTPHCWIDPEELARALGDRAEVYALETGDPTWELTDALPDRLDVYGGAVRIWWPGLRRDSDPYDHKLYFIHSPADAERVFGKIVHAIQGAGSGTADPAVLKAQVLAIGKSTAVLTADGIEGELRDADVPIHALVRCLRVGLELEVRRCKRPGQVSPSYSVCGLLPSPWDLAAKSLRVGDVVESRVTELRPNGVQIEVLPGVPGFVYWTYVDWEIDQHELPQLVQPGQIVHTKISAIDSDRRSLKLSIKDAHPSLGGELRPSPSLVPGGEPYTWHEPDGRTTPEIAEPSSSPAPATPGNREDESLTEELEAANTDRRQLRAKNRELRKQLRATQDSLEDLERKTAHELDPLSSERAFLQAVRVTYAKRFDEGSREDHPLRRMRIGSQWIESIRVTDGIELDKVLEVCTQVAAGMAHELSARDVHPLRSGPGGSRSVVRGKDRAQAWRCALQIKTPSARRMHWWSIPGKDGATIEFAKVGLHDDMSIPE